MSTPEGRVKTKLKKILDALPHIYYFSPATGGYGRSGVPDIVGCYRGRFFGIEVKAEGKAGNATALQVRELKKIEDAGGIAFVYDGTMTDEEVKQKLGGGV